MSNLIHFGPLSNLQNEMLDDQNKSESVEQKLIDGDDAIDRVEEHIPFVMLCSDLELCISLLDKKRDIIKRSSSRVILIGTEKDPDEKTLKKLVAKGMSEFLPGGTPIKSLQYKTSLLLKALPKFSDEEKSDFFVVKNKFKVKKEEVMVVKAMAEIISPSGEKLKIKKVSELLKIEKEKLQTMSKEQDFPEYVENFKKQLDELEELLFQLEEDGHEKALAPVQTKIKEIDGVLKMKELESIQQFCFVPNLMANKDLFSGDTSMQELAMTVLFDSVAFLRSVAEEIKEGEQNLLENIANQNFKNRFIAAGEKMPALNDVLAGLGFTEQIAA
jgi:hypothetical protein